VVVVAVVVDVEIGDEVLCVEEEVLVELVGSVLLVVLVVVFNVECVDGVLFEEVVLVVVFGVE
jgi:hypothetical protein